MPSTSCLPFPSGSGGGAFAALSWALAKHGVSTKAAAIKYVLADFGIALPRRIGVVNETVSNEPVLGYWLTTDNDDQSRFWAIVTRHSSLIARFPGLISGSSRRPRSETRRWTRKPSST